MLWARVAQLRERGVRAFALELVPRITRAQSMDVLSSQSTVAGYKAVLVGAGALGKLLPMLTTAAGTIAPAKVFVIGAGVAGLQAIATARRLGAVVTAFDVRPAAKEQVESLGAKFVAGELVMATAEAAGGYARAQTEEEQARTREALAAHLREVDLVVTTAQIPGRAAPRLVTAEMVAGMRAGAVIVDLAAESGGNCELTRAGETVDANGVSIIGPVNIASTVPYHASQMLSRNVETFVKHLVKDGALVVDEADEITGAMLVTKPQGVGRGA
jgi:NAD(P) transhydrogenase subunit alpha